jgi:hypothetical protein
MAPDLAQVDRVIARYQKRTPESVANYDGFVTVPWDRVLRKKAAKKKRKPVKVVMVTPDNKPKLPPAKHQPNWPEPTKPHDGFRSPPSAPSTPVMDRVYAARRPQGRRPLRPFGARAEGWR